MDKCKEKIIVNVQAEGDRSVGMFPISLKMTIEGLDMKRDIEDCMENGRRDFRRDIMEFYTEWLDYGKVMVTFSDECGDCLSVLVNGNCINKGCVNNF